MSSWRARAALLGAALLAGVALVMVPGDAAGAAKSAGDGWSQPVTIDRGNELTSVSCPSARFCMAVDGAGNAFVFDGTSWSGPQPVTPGNGLLGVSCTSATFCLATGGDSVSIYRGSSWAESGPFASEGVTIGAVSCVSASFCAAMTLSPGATAGAFVAGVSIYNGASWSTPRNIGIKATLIDDVSCASSSFCVAVGNTGKFPGAASIYNGASWSRPDVLNPREHPYGGGPLISVSCAGRALCIANDSNPLAQHTFRYNGHRWSRPQVIGTPNHFILLTSCATAHFCMATTTESTSRSFNGTSWSSPSRQVARAELNSLSCASPKLCVAVGDFGVAVVYRG